MMGYIIACLVLLILVVQDILHRIERKDLYNRIMAGSLEEYQINNNTVKRTTKVSKNPLKERLEQAEKERRAKYERGEID